jgi:hypothetical protein
MVLLAVPCVTVLVDKSNFYAYFQAYFSQLTEDKKYKKAISKRAGGGW